MANTSPIDLNAMAASIYQTIMNVQKSAEELVGLDVLWMRAIPYANSEDVIVQEYTLSNVDCPQPIRIIQNKSDYAPGAYSLDMFGMSYENPLEISINIESWQAIYGKTTIPQKGDLVLVKAYNRMYEVASMTIQYMLQSIPQYYKCTLTKYQRKASRKESEDIRISIDELTTSQDRLFGDAIANEVADAVVERETSYTQSTRIDPICEFDTKSVITEDICGPDDILFAPAYYDFNIAKKNVIYKNIEASYNMEAGDINSHWIYTCWFRIGHATEETKKTAAKNQDPVSVLPEKNNNDKPITITGLYSKDKTYYRFTYTTSLHLNPGDAIVLYRGTLFSFSGIIEETDCLTGTVIRLNTGDVLTAAKKASKWWETIKSGWKIKKTVIELPTASSSANKIIEKKSSYNLFSAYSGINKQIDITATSNNISINFGNIKKTVTLKKELVQDAWHYICLDFNLKQIDIKIARVDVDEKLNKKSDIVLLDKVYSCGNIKGFMIDNAGLENIGLDINMCNIRLYESEYEMGNKYKIDMYSNITRNASKLILVDNPLPVNNLTFVSTLK